MVGELPPKAEQRPKARSRVLLAGIVSYAGGAHSFRCSIRNLSENGAKISVPNGLALPKEVFLIDIRARFIHTAERIWWINESAGLKFLQTTPIDELGGPSLGYLKRLLVSASPTPNGL